MISINTSCCYLSEKKDDDNNATELINKVNDSITQSEEKKREIKMKLDSLLSKMLNEKKGVTLDIPIPREKRKVQEINELKEIQKKKEKMLKERFDNRLSSAAATVATTLGGDTSKTESELLDIYFRKADSGKTNAEEEKPSTPESLGSLLSSMKFERVRKENTRSYQVQIAKQFSRRPRPPDMPLSKKSAGVTEKVDILNSTPLGIFDTEDQAEKQPVVVDSVAWNYFQQRETALTVTHPPANVFEQMILWTEQGKLWKFPINNEQDFIEEENVDFSEHVFLEHLIDDWCPSEGPIRDFMQLVCTGLSKNPYVPVKEKHAHIYFYEHYFRAKNDILTKLGLENIKDRQPPELKQEAASG